MNKSVPQNPAPASPGDADPQESTAVLVVEDEFLVGLEICDMLESIGCRPLGPASSVEGAISLLEADPPSCALLDEELMGRSVAPFARRLKALGIPFAIISGYSESISDDALMEGAPRYPKPLTYSLLHTILEALKGGDCIASDRRPDGRGTGTGG
ncbi:hypothetical protein [Pelagibius sp. 7325]|uniref:response regulator n=1 Tax=Pelagibius sp. 7325 TaxID=3131994 RepID=UPI0030EF91F3